MMTVLETTFPNLVKNQNKPITKQDYIKYALFWSVIFLAGGMLWTRTVKLTQWAVCSHLDKLFEAFMEK